MLREKILDLLFEEKLTQREITLRVGASRSRVSELLDELENEKLIERKRISERTVLVSINRDRILRLGILKSSEYAVVVLSLSHLSEEVPFKIRVYDNSLDALKDLMTGYLDMVASPLISGYFFYLIDNDIKPIAGVAYGGSGILKGGPKKMVIGTTPLSKMDEESRGSKGYTQVYYNSIEEILRAFQRGDIDAAQIWEPYVTIYGASRSISDKMCCSLFTDRAPTHAMNQFLAAYHETLKHKLNGEDREEASRILSGLLEIDPSVISLSTDSYRFSSRISKEDLQDQIRKFGLPAGREVDGFLERYSKISI